MSPAAKEKTRKKTGKANAVKTLSLALQGGGAQGAFTWGVLDELLANPRIHIEAVTGTSAGAMNAVVLAYGLITDGRDGARKLLEEFWRKVSIAGSMSPLQPTFWDKLMGNTDLSYSPSFMAMDYLTTVLSPYQFNLFDFNPLRDILKELVDFDVIRKNHQIKLFINATNVRTGKIKVFETHELTLDMVMASACLPYIYKTVYVEGEPYWDGGYSGNPALYPLFYKTACKDILLIQINPLVVDDVPTGAGAILDRVNEISFNGILMREMRAIQFVRDLIDDDQVSEQLYKRMRIHMIEAGSIMAALGRASKLNTDWSFLQHLCEAGNQSANDWIADKLQKVGIDSTVDIKEVFL